jgi:hypothetical protein
VLDTQQQQHQRGLAQASSSSSSSFASTAGQKLSIQLASLQRCHGVRGSHCVDYYTQPYVALKQPQVHSKPCPNSCSGRGVCNGDTGLCDCPAGMRQQLPCKTMMS